MQNNIDFSKMSQVMRLCGYEALPGGKEAIRKAEDRETAATSSQPEPETQPQPILAGIPADAEASLSEWYDERNQQENEREEQEREWAAQEQLQAETDA